MCVRVCGVRPECRTMGIMFPHYFNLRVFHFKVVGTTYDLSSLKQPWNGYQAVANSQVKTQAWQNRCRVVGV